MRTIKAILVRNTLKFVRNKMRLFFTVFMSVLFLFIFSFVMKNVNAGPVQPLNYLISGIIIMTVFQAALNNSMHILDDIAGGFMKEILVAPIARWQVAIGQILSSALIAFLQGVIIILMGLFMGFKTDVMHFTEMTVLMVLVGITFASMGLFLATIAKESTTFQILITLISLPLTFLSGAYIPTVVLPTILLPIVFLNPLTYTTAAFRYLALQMDHWPVEGLVDVGVAFNVQGFVILPWFGMVLTLLIGLIFFLLCVYRFGKADFSQIKVFNRHPH